MAKMIPNRTSNTPRLVCDHPQDALADNSLTPEERTAMRCTSKTFWVKRFADGKTYLVCSHCAAEHPISAALAPVEA